MFFTPNPVKFIARATVWNNILTFDETSQEIQYCSQDDETPTLKVVDVSGRDGSDLDAAGFWALADLGPVPPKAKGACNSLRSARLTFLGSALSKRIQELSKGGDGDAEEMRAFLAAESRHSGRAKPKSQATGSPGDWGRALYRAFLGAEQILIRVDTSGGDQVSKSKQQKNPSAPANLFIQLDYTIVS